MRNRWDFNLSPKLLKDVIYFNGLRGLMHFLIICYLESIKKKPVWNVIILCPFPGVLDLVPDNTISYARFLLLFSSLIK